MTVLGIDGELRAGADVKVHTDGMTWDVHRLEFVARGHFRGFVSDNVPSADIIAVDDGHELQVTVRR